MESLAAGPLRCTERAAISPLFAGFPAGLQGTSAKRVCKPTWNEKFRDLQSWKKGKDPHPQDKIQHLDFTKDPQPLYYKTPPCAFYHKMSVARPFPVLSKDEIGL